MADFEVNIDELGGGEIHVINARGYIDTVTAPELEKYLLELMRKKAYKLVVNLKDVSYISSAGWGIFVSELRDIRENGGDLVLVEMSPDVYDVYELMEFSSILKSFDTLDDSLRNFGFTPKDPSQVPDDQKAAAASSSEPAMEPEADAQPESGNTGMASADLNTKILDVIKNNPYFDEKQIRSELNTPKYGSQKVGFFEIKKILKSLGMDDSRKRFEYGTKA